MLESAVKRSPFGPVTTGYADAWREAIARARWIALDLETPRFSVLAMNSCQDRGRLTLCFDDEFPQASAASRALRGPSAKSLLAHASQATNPCVWTSDELADFGLPLLRRIDAPVLGTSGMAFPVTSRGGLPGLVVFFGHRGGLAERQVFDIHARCFQLFESATALLATTPTATAIATRERDCLNLSSHGLTSDEIGAELCLSPHTVNQYLTNTARKLGAVNRVHVVAKALRLGLIS